jgi:simple sugar transport system permease protein
MESTTQAGAARSWFARLDRERILLGLAAPVIAVLFAALVTSIVLLISGKNPVLAISDIFSYDIKPNSTVFILNRGTSYYLAGLAVAIGFRMNLFNIGVEGQYRMAAFFAAFVGGNLNLPGPLRIILMIVVAVLVGGMWAGLVGVLKVTRGVNEVIASIMLNFIATGGIIAYLAKPGRLASAFGNDVHTKPLPDSAHFFTFSTYGGQIWGFVIIAALMGVAFHLVLSRTSFGFDLRTAGRSDGAALASGVNVKKMIVTAMFISGGMAGLIGMPQLLQESFSYSLTFPQGWGFVGISVALLGRNNPVGIAFGALLWAALDNAGQQLTFDGFDTEIVGIIQGTIVISVVVAYEIVRRYGLTRQQQKVGRQLAAQLATAAPEQKETAA